MDRLESMAVFVDVVQAGSLVAAAERRGLSPSMVGKHLRALEERVGLRLLQRTTRRQKLTEAGNSSSNAAWRCCSRSRRRRRIPDRCGEALQDCYASRRPHLSV